MGGTAELWVGPSTTLSNQPLPQGVGLAGAHRPEVWRFWPSIASNLNELLYVIIGR